MAFPPQPIAKSPAAGLVADIMRHYPKGNVVKSITKIVVNGNKSLGIAGTITEVVADVCPEPWINALSVNAVLHSGGSFRFTDQKMQVARDSLTAVWAMDKHSEFSVNGNRYEILAVTPGPSAWEFVIRRKTAEPVTP